MTSFGALAWAAAAGWAWLASGVRTFTRPAEALTFLPGLAVVLLTLRPSARLRRKPAGADPPTPPTGHRRRRVLPWFLLGAAIVGWELTQLFSQPRQLHPTLSSLTNSALSTHPSRFVGYLIWLGFGWLLIRDLRGRRE